MPYSMVIHGDPWKETQPYITFITPTLVIHGDPLFKKKKYISWCLALKNALKQRPETPGSSGSRRRLRDVAMPGRPFGMDRRATMVNLDGSSHCGWKKKPVLSMG